MQVEKYFQSALVYKDPEIACAGLLACIKIARTNPEAVRRWISEITDNITRQPSIVAYHALAAMYAVRKSDPMSVARVLMQAHKAVTNPQALMLVVRYAADVIRRRHGLGAGTEGADMSDALSAVPLMKQNGRGRKIPGIPGKVSRGLGRKRFSA